MTSPQEQKIREAINVLEDLGLPERQQNKRTALVLLSMFGIAPDMSWRNCYSNRLGITESMEWMAVHYPDIKKGKIDPTRYQPNTRESVRRQSVHQLVAAGILEENSDSPGRATNDQNYSYRPTLIALETVPRFGTSAWVAAVDEFQAAYGVLRVDWDAERASHRVPVKLPDGSNLSLSPGKHSELIAAVVDSFAPIYAPGGYVVYLGDTGSKWRVNEREYLGDLGVLVSPHGKMPDVVIHYAEKDWLILVEAVTSHGPVDSKRVAELKALFRGARPGLVFVTAFRDKTSFKRYLAEIAWETEVWIADNPTHLIHFNGDRFLGPYGALEA